MCGIEKVGEESAGFNAFTGGDGVEITHEQVGRSLPGCHGAKDFLHFCLSNAITYRAFVEVGCQVDHKDGEEVAVVFLESYLQQVLFGQDVGANVSLYIFYR